MYLGTLCHAAGLVSQQCRPGGWAGWAGGSNTLVQHKYIQQWRWSQLIEIVYLIHLIVLASVLIVTGRSFHAVATQRGLVDV